MFLVPISFSGNAYSYINLGMIPVFSENQFHEFNEVLNQYCAWKYTLIFTDFGHVFFKFLL